MTPERLEEIRGKLEKDDRRLPNGIWQREAGELLAALDEAEKAARKLGDEDLIWALTTKHEYMERLESANDVVEAARAVELYCPDGDGEQRLRRKRLREALKRHDDLRVPLPSPCLRVMK